MKKMCGNGIIYLKFIKPISLLFQIFQGLQNLKDKLFLSSYLKSNNETKVFNFIDLTIYKLIVTYQFEL